MSTNSAIPFQPDLSACRKIASRQEGSVIVIVLMLLVIMSIIGVASTNTTVTENFIVRNAAIRKQNHNMVDAVATEALQRAMDTAYVNNNTNQDPSDTDADITPGTSTALNWVIDSDIWENTVMADGKTKQGQWYDPTYVGWVLVNDDEALDPNLDLDNVSEPTWEAPSSLRKNRDEGIVSVLIDRGDWNLGDGAANSPIRYALVGWESAQGSSLRTTGNVPIKRTAEILAEYVSEDYGVTRVTVGMVRYF